MTHFRTAVLRIFGCLVFLSFVNLSYGQPPTVDSPGFQDDLGFLRQHTQIVLLGNGDSAIAIAPAYQARVMTSTFDRKSGPSFGWINRPVIKKGFLIEAERRGRLEEHIYIFGGEERFWLGPEGGQYSLFFKPGTKFVFDDWTTPAAIDIDGYKMVEKSDNSARFAHQTELVNYSGTRFDVGIERSVKLLDAKDVEELIGGPAPTDLRMVGYETDNRVTNRGGKAWTPETGLISIWMLGMYNPSPTTTVVIPFQPGDVSLFGKKVNDTYFGKVPSEYLVVDEDVLFFRGDGTRRGKIGISPERSKGIAGSYDSDGGVLTVVTYNAQPAPHGYVNSMWELQEEPYAGDVINAYNDGSPEPGKAPLGPFYELETSSPAAALKPGETMKHVQRTWHIQGDEMKLDPIARRLFGVGLKEIGSKF